MIETKFGSGREVQRVEDDRLLRGEGLFVDDAAIASARVCFVRSPHANARITRIDTEIGRAHV